MSSPYNVVFIADSDFKLWLLCCCFRFRAKLGVNQTESPIIASLPQGIALEFERSDAARKLRLMLSELLFIMYQVFANS